MVGEKEADQVRIHRYVQTCELIFEQPVSYYRQQIERGYVPELDFGSYHVMITGLPRQVYRPCFGTDAFAYAKRFHRIEIDIAQKMEEMGVRCMTTMLLYDHTKRFCMIFNRPEHVSALDVAELAAERFNRLYAELFEMSKTPYCNYTVVSEEIHGYENLPRAYRAINDLSRQQFFDMRTMIMTPQLLARTRVSADKEQIHEDTMQLYIALKAGDRAGIGEHFGNVIRQLKAARDFELLEDTLRRLRSMLENTMNSHGRELSEQEGTVFNAGQYPTIDHMAQAIEACLIFCAGQLRDCSAMSVPIREAVRYIRHHYAEDVSLDMVAQYVGMSPSWVSRRFSQECGCSIPQYLLSVRMERAKALLLETDKHVFEVAQEVGIENSRYFVSLFRKSTGMTPTAYREQKHI